MADSYTDGTIEGQHGATIEFLPNITVGDTTTRAFNVNYVNEDENFSPPSTFNGRVLVACSVPTDIGAGLLRYTATYCEIPAARTEYSSGTYTSPPTYTNREEVILYRRTVGTTPSTGLIPTVSDPSRTRFFSQIQKPSETRVVGARIEVSYTRTPQSAQIFTEESFEIIQAEPSIYQSVYFGVDVTREDEGAITVVPTGDVGVIQGTTVTRWLGPIYEVRTAYRL